MKRGKVIAFTGYKGSGKDTAADLLMEFIGDQLAKDRLGIKKLGFAYKLKETIGDLFNLTQAELYDPALKEVILDRWPHQTPREIMQTFATEGVRKLWPDLWVECWAREIEVYLAGGDWIVLTDLRFPNEYAKIMTEDSVIIRVHRDGYEGDGHESESHYDTFSSDYDIHNNSDLEELKFRVAALSTQILNRR